MSNFSKNSDYPLPLESLKSKDVRILLEDLGITGKELAEKMNKTQGSFSQRLIANRMNVRDIVQIRNISVEKTGDDVAFRAVLNKIRLLKEVYPKMNSVELRAVLEEKEAQILRLKQHISELQDDLEIKQSKRKKAKE